MNPFEGGLVSNCESPKQMSGRNLTLTEQLESRKSDLEKRLEEINQALEGLKKNPEIEAMLNLISRVRY